MAKSNGMPRGNNRTLLNCTFIGLKEFPTYTELTLESIRTKNQYKFNQLVETIIQPNLKLVKGVRLSLELETMGSKKKLLGIYELRHKVLYLDLDSGTKEYLNPNSHMVVDYLSNLYKELKGVLHPWKN